MKVKIGREKLNFDPNHIHWKYQSSPDCQFGFWRTRGTSVFVKRFLHQPAGWNLLRYSLKHPIPNTPGLLDLVSDEQHLYLFADKLEGDVLLNILQKNQVRKYFSETVLSAEQRLKLFIAVYATVRHINAQGYWYPDLDLKNIFIGAQQASGEAFLIDIDSCAEHQRPFKPDHVSQVYWEGMVSTYHRLGRKFINRDNPVLPAIVPNGAQLNQSMILLFAYSIQRLGLVPNDMPLYEPLIHPKNPHGRRVLRIHENLARGENCWTEIDALLPEYFKISAARFESLVKQHSGQKNRWYDKLVSKILRAV